MPRPKGSKDPAKVGAHVYKKLFENNRVRVFHITFKPGDKVGMHGHPAHVVYGLSKGTLHVTPSNGKTEVWEVKKGAVMFSPATRHKAVNKTDKEVNALVVELMK